ncbi:MAG: transposase [Anaerolineae bacterium]|nr:transposase [Anaerolineae bacterium]
MLEELTLLVIYLSSWEEQVAPGLTVRRAWKGYLFEVLDELEEQGHISQTRRAKSLTLTEEGVLRAQELEARYTP